MVKTIVNRNGEIKKWPNGEQIGKLYIGRI